MKTLALALCLLCATAAAAPSPADLASAKQHFLQGRAFQEAAAYPQAIAEYRAAYALAPLPDLIFNLAQCYRLGGDAQSAIDHYRRYLAAAPRGRGARDARSFIAQLTKQIAEAPAPSPSPPPSPPPSPSPSPYPSPSPSPSPSAAGSVPVPAPALPSGHHRGRTLRITGLVTIAAGVLLLGGGVVYGLEARSTADQLEHLDSWDPALYDEGRAANRNMIILVSAGSAAVIGGGVLYLLGRRAAREPRLAVTPSRAGAAFTVQGRF